MLVLNVFRHSGRYRFLRSLVQILVRYSFSAGPIAQFEHLDKFSVTCTLLWLLESSVDISNIYTSSYISQDDPAENGLRMLEALANYSA